MLVNLDHFPRARDENKSDLKPPPSYLGVEPKIVGKPPKWMVKIMENPMNKWKTLDFRCLKFLKCQMPLRVAYTTSAYTYFSNI